VMQFGGIGVTVGMDIGFCVIVTHWATYHLLCSYFSQGKSFLSSPNCRTHKISVWITFGCTLLQKLAWRGHILQPCKTKNWMHGQKLEGSKSSIPPVREIVAASIEQVCVHCVAC
jgi:hypothetical protein